MLFHHMCSFKSFLQLTSKNCNKSVHSGISITSLNFKQTEIWTGIKKYNGNWMIANGRTLSDFESDWADGEPSEGQNKDCAYMEKDLK